MKNRVLIVEFYDSGVCKSEPKEWTKIKDIKDGDVPEFNDYVTCGQLIIALANNLHNLEWGNHLQIRLKIVTKKQWLEAERLGREQA